MNISWGDVAAMCVFALVGMGATIYGICKLVMWLL